MRVAKKNALLTNQQATDILSVFLLLNIAIMDHKSSKEFWVAWSKGIIIFCSRFNFQTKKIFWLEIIRYLLSLNKVRQLVNYTIKLHAALLLCVFTTANISNSCCELKCRFSLHIFSHSLLNELVKAWSMAISPVHWFWSMSCLLFFKVEWTVAASIGDEE